MRNRLKVVLEAHNHSLHPKLAFHLLYSLNFNVATYTYRCSWMCHASPRSGAMFNARLCVHWYTNIPINQCRSRDPDKITSIDWVYLLIGFFLTPAYNVQYLNNTVLSPSDLSNLLCVLFVECRSSVWPCSYSKVVTPYPLHCKQFKLSRTNRSESEICEFNCE